VTFAKKSENKDESTTNEIQIWSRI